MEAILKSIGFFGLLTVFFVTIIGIIFIFRLLLKHNKKHEPSKNKFTSILDSKKYEDVNIDRFRPIIINLSFILSLALIVSIFEFPFAGEKEEEYIANSTTTEYEEQHEIPPTEQLPPPPPKIKHPVLIAVANEEIVEQEIEIDLDVEMDEETVIEELTEPKFVVEIEEEEENYDQVFLIVEENAEPIGGYKAFYDFFYQHVKYPRAAKRIGIEGKVYLQFVINPTGEISNIKVLKGIGGGCDEEAIRVLKKAPKWKPAKQRGRNVKQLMSVPIFFKIANG